ncbi:MAG: arginine--tRNA ligase, partial [Thermomicrobiales bacterium]
MTASKPAAGGIIAREEARAAEAIAAAIADLGFPARTVDLRPLPFEGTWGVASSVCFGLANDAVMAELEQSGKLEGLSKKEAKQLAGAAVKERVPALAEDIVARLGGAGFASAEAANGYINIAFDANQVASRLIGEVLDRGDAYGNAPAIALKVMVEHSQPNTHKAFHVGHLRNSCLGVSLSHIMRAAGYQVQDANYIGDIGMHVIKCLWCYQNFHRGEEPADPVAKGRWLGEVYAEADARLNFRKEVLDFLLLLSTEDQQFISAIDRMLKYLWRQGGDGDEVVGEDIAYLLGRVANAQPIKDELLFRQNVISRFWPIVGEQLVDAIEHPRVLAPVEGMPEPTTTPEERLATWQKLAVHMDAWWVPSETWRDEIKALFQLWEEQDPAFVQLWEETREWSLADFRRIFAELGATFDVWFYESQVEEPGKQ